MEHRSGKKLERRGERLRAMKYLLILALVPLIYQDFKDRAISWYFLVILFTLLMVLNFSMIGMSKTLINLCINALIITVLLIVAWLWFFVRDRQLGSFVDKRLGLGDILFLYVIAVRFSPINYLVFLISSFIITLLFWGVAAHFSSKARLIPLAGMLSICLIIIHVIDNALSNYSIVSDSWIIGVL